MENVFAIKDIIQLNIVRNVINQKIYLKMYILIIFHNHMNYAIKHVKLVTKGEII